jgi:hypothetical protein
MESEDPEPPLIDPEVSVLLPEVEGVELVSEVVDDMSEEEPLVLSAPEVPLRELFLCLRCVVVVVSSVVEVEEPPLRPWSEPEPMPEVLPVLVPVVSPVDEPLMDEPEVPIVSEEPVVPAAPVPIDPLPVVPAPPEL